MKISRWIMTAAVAGMVAAGAVGPVNAADNAASATTKAVKKQTVCPVMGGPINTEIYADANGKRVYFCCDGCPSAFKKNPEKYIKKMEAEGITLDKTPAGATTIAPAASKR